LRHVGSVSSLSDGPGDPILQCPCKMTAKVQSQPTNTSFKLKGSRATHHFDFASHQLIIPVKYPRGYRCFEVVLFRVVRNSNSQILIDQSLPEASASGSLGWPPDVALEIAIVPGFWAILLIAAGVHKKCSIMRDYMTWCGTYLLLPTRNTM
jgi:hypothetical protein